MEELLPGQEQGGRQEGLDQATELALFPPRRIYQYSESTGDEEDEQFKKKGAASSTDSSANTSRENSQSQPLPGGAETPFSTPLSSKNYTGAPPSPLKLELGRATSSTESSKAGGSTPPTPETPERSRESEEPEKTIPLPDIDANISPDHPKGRTRAETKAPAFVDGPDHPLHRLAPGFLKILGVYRQKIEEGNTKKPNKWAVLKYMWRKRISLHSIKGTPEFRALSKEQQETFAQFARMLTLTDPGALVELHATLATLLAHDQEEELDANQKTNRLLNKLVVVFESTRTRYQEELHTLRDQYLDQLFPYYFAEYYNRSEDISEEMQQRLETMHKDFVDYCNRVLKGGIKYLKENPNDKPATHPSHLILSELQYDLLKIRKRLLRRQNKLNGFLKKQKSVLNRTAETLAESKLIRKKASDAERDWLDLEYEAVPERERLQTEKDLQAKNQTRQHKKTARRRALLFTLLASIGETGVGTIIAASFFAHYTLAMACVLAAIIAPCVFITQVCLFYGDLYLAFKTGIKKLYEKLSGRKRVALALIFGIGILGSIAVAGNSAYANFTEGLAKLFGPSLAGKIFGIGIASLPVVFTFLAIFFITFNIVAGWMNDPDAIKNAIDERLFMYALANRARAQRNSARANLKFAGYISLDVFKYALGITLSAVFAWLSFSTFQNNTSSLMRGLMATSSVALGFAIAAAIADAIFAYIFDATTATRLADSIGDRFYGTYAPLTLRLDRIKPANEVEELDSQAAKAARWIAGASIAVNALGNAGFFAFSKGANGQMPSPSRQAGIWLSTVPHSAVGPALLAHELIDADKFARRRKPNPAPARGGPGFDFNIEDGSIELDALALPQPPKDLFVPTVHAH